MTEAKSESRYEEPRLTLFVLMAYAEWVEETLKTPGGVAFEDFCLARGFTQANKLTRLIAKLEDYAGDYLVKRRFGPTGEPSYSTKKSTEDLPSKSVLRSSEPTDLGLIWAGLGSIVSINWEILDDSYAAHYLGLLDIQRRHWRELEELRREIAMTGSGDHYEPKRACPF